MPFFKDANGREWKVNFDGVMLKALRDDQQVNLADVGGAGYVLIQNDPAALVGALLVICADEIRDAGLDAKRFAAVVVGESLDRAWEAVWGAAGLFFQARLWSALQLNFKRQSLVLEAWQALQPAMTVMSKPEIPPAMRDAAMAQLAMIMNTVSTTDFQKLAVNQSASGPVENPSTPVTGSQDTAALK